VRACGVNKHACVRACELNSRTLKERLTGVKIIFLMLFMVHLANFGLFYVAVGDHFARCPLVGERGIGPS
jgi:hypothetical protein